MISDDPAPAVAWAPPTKKTPYIARLGNQAINPVGKAHATIRGRYCRALPVARWIYLSRKFFVFKGKLFAYLGLTFIHHKTQKGRLKPINTCFRRPHPAVAWALPTKKTPCYRPTRKPNRWFRGQSPRYNPQQYHAPYPPSRWIYPSRKFFVVLSEKVLCFS